MQEKAAVRKLVGMSSRILKTTVSLVTQRPDGAETVQSSAQRLCKDIFHALFAFERRCNVDGAMDRPGLHC